MRGNELLERMGDVDPAYIEAADRKPAVKKNRIVRWGVTAACICVLIGSAAAALAESGLGTRLIDTFTGRTEAGSDYSESGFDMAVSAGRVHIADLSEEIRQTGNIIKQQYIDHKPYDNHSPDHWQREFDSRDSACEFVGLSCVKQPDLDWNEQMTLLNVHGDAAGRILTLSLETLYNAGDVRIQFFTWIYTENSNEEIIIGSRTTEDVGFSESFYTTDSGVLCHVIESTELESGFMSVDGYIVDNSILYFVHISYLEKDAGQATGLLHQWADLF